MARSKSHGQCPWCSTALPRAGLATCPSCGASLVESEAAQVPGVTVVDPEVARHANPERPRKGRGLLGFLTGEGAAEAPAPPTGITWQPPAQVATPPAPSGSATPLAEPPVQPAAAPEPWGDTRIEMLRLELAALEAEVAHRRAELALLEAQRAHGGSPSTASGEPGAGAEPA
jgi:hypothetical protein